MAALAFYFLATLIFINAGASSIVMIPRIHDHRFKLTFVLSLGLAISTFTAFISMSWPILIAGFGIYCLGQILDVVFFSDRNQKFLYPFIGIYSIATVGSFLSFFLGLKVLFLVTYVGYWTLNYLINSGFFSNARLNSKDK
ncbi:MAG: hypothetical protein AAF696_34945 [Bacteroidota bacterium]